MTALDDIAASARSQADAYGQTQYTQGKADQALTDAAALASVQSSADGLQTALTAMTRQRDEAQTLAAQAEADLNAYKASHPDTTPPPPPPPVDPPVIVGMNFIHGTTLPQETQAKAARIYVPSGQTDITTLSEFQRARAAGITTVVLSWKDSAVPKWLTTVPKGITWYGVAHHEPENDGASFTAAQWRALQALHMPAVRKAGGIPTAILMAWTLDAASGRKVSDWVLPAGTVDVYGFDLYPKTVKGQAASIAAIKAALPVFGVKRWLLGEYGVPTSNPTLGVQMIQALKPQVADADVILYWSQQVSASTTDYHFTAQTAAAWLS